MLSQRKWSSIYYNVQSKHFSRHKKVKFIIIFCFNVLNYIFPGNFILIVCTKQRKFIFSILNQLISDMANFMSSAEAVKQSKHHPIDVWGDVHHWKVRVVSWYLRPHSLIFLALLLYNDSLQDLIFKVLNFPFLWYVIICVCGGMGGDNVFSKAAK